MRKIAIGVIGLAQMHIVGMTESFLALPERFAPMGFADSSTPLSPVSTEPGTRRGTRAALLRKCPFPREYADPLELLDDQPDLVLVAAENSLHAQICCEALSRGIHVIVEKPMALSLGEARRMAAASRLHKALLWVNWPTAWFPAFRTAQRLAEQGAAGVPLRFAYTNAESLGPFSYGQNLSSLEKAQEWWYRRELGGGAMIDYLGYGCNLSRWFLGEKAVAAFASSWNFLTDFADVEDHATLVLRFRRAQALIEGTWATLSAGHIPSGPVVYGDRGTLVTDKKAGSVQLFTERFQGAPTRVFEPEPLAEGRRDLAHEYLHFLDTGEEHPALGLEVNLDAMAALDAALRSASSGKLELL